MPAERSQEYMGNIWGIHKEQKDSMAVQGVKAVFVCICMVLADLLFRFAERRFLFVGSIWRVVRIFFRLLITFFSRCTYGIDGRTYEVDLFFPGCLPPYWLFATASRTLGAGPGRDMWLDVFPLFFLLRLVLRCFSRWNGVREKFEPLPSPSSTELGAETGTCCVVSRAYAGRQGTGRSHLQSNPRPPSSFTPASRRVYIVHKRGTWPGGIPNPARPNCYTTSSERPIGLSGRCGVSGQLASSASTPMPLTQSVLSHMLGTPIGGSHGHNITLALLLSQAAECHLNPAAWFQQG
jgi:hypothetical protein